MFSRGNIYSMNTISEKVFGSEGDSGISERGMEEIGAHVVIGETGPIGEKPNKLFIFVLRAKQGDDFYQWLYECVYSGVY